MRFAVLTALLVATTACEPRFVENSAEVDAYLVRGQYTNACVALRQKHHDYDDLRRYTADKLSEFNDPSANACICEEVVNHDRGWDAAIAEGLASTKRDDLADCLAPALDQPVENKKDLVYAMAGIAAPQSYAALARFAKSSGDAEHREAAVRALRPSEAHVPLMIELLTTDSEQAVRAAAAYSLADRERDDVIEAIGKVVTEDESGLVRAEAIAAVVSLKLPQTNKIVCDAMLEDPDAAVRLQAVKQVKGTKKEDLIACLEKRLLTKEEDGAVREAVLASLGASPSDKAALALCNAIGPVIRTYVTGEGNKVAQDIAGADIIKAQNNRDWERSWDCVAAAKRQGGYSCYGRNYLNWWYKELGGSTTVPWCPGMPNKPDQPG